VHEPEKACLSMPGTPRKGVGLKKMIKGTDDLILSFSRGLESHLSRGLVGVKPGGGRGPQGPANPERSDFDGQALENTSYQICHRLQGVLRST